MMNRKTRRNAILLIAVVGVLTAASIHLRADTGTCAGASITLPFVDVPNTNIFFCVIAGAYFSGLTNGTDATHYGPSVNVPREQMAAFVTRTMDQSLKRGSRRAALHQFWNANALTFGPVVGLNPRLVKSDGADLWVANFGDNTIARVRASDAKLLGTWTGATNAFGVVVASTLIVVSGRTNPGSLFALDPSLPPGPVFTLSSTLGINPSGVAYDGNNIWTANPGTGPGTGSVSEYLLAGGFANTISTGFSQPLGILFDGTNIWVTDIGDNTLKKLDSGGSVIQTVMVGSSPQFPVFDGTNIWVPNIIDNTVTVVRASTGAVLATLSANGLDSPRSAAFDGIRILITNSTFSLSMWKATDLSPIGAFSVGSSNNPFGACSDGLSFWITLTGNGRLIRF